MPEEQLVIGGLTPWLVGETDAAARALGELALRRALLPKISLVFDEPRPDGRSAAELWPELVAAVQPAGWTMAIVRRRPTATTLRTTRLQSTVAADIAAAYTERPLGEVALGHARATAAIAVRTLEQLADDGWRSIIGDGPGGADGGRLGADAVAERSDPFDPLGAELSRVG